MKKDNIIPPMNQPPALPKHKIDPASLEDIKCENKGCGNYTFTEVTFLKRVPGLMTENGKDGIIPIPAFACNACGFVNEMFVPSFMRKGKLETTTEPPSLILEK